MREPADASFQSLAGYTSHLAGQEYLLLTPSTTESSGPAWSFAHIYSGSFSAEIELDFNGHLRCQTGINPLHLSYPLPPGGIFTTPELVLSYTSHGIGTLSRNLHRFWKSHLFNTDWVGVPRPTLVNNWEATYFDLSEKKLLPIAERGAELGIQLFVLDDGWFGRKYPRTSDKQGLGDWEVNEERFPKGLGEFGERVTGLELGKKARSSLHGGGGEGGIKGGNGSESRGGREGRQDTREKDKPEHMRFGLWVEPEMISRRSHLFESHPDWVLRSPSTSPTETRNQLVLDLGQHQVQDFIISTLSRLLDSAPISYIKWDNNRAMHELPHPSAMHRYQLGLYRVLSTLTSKYPHVLWEGCASGGGRIDLALSAYFAQHWTSDNTDALDRLGIQFGTSLFFPPSIMGAHVSVVPNHQTSRTTPFEFRAHVALMAGSFGFELDVTKLSREEADMVPKFVRLARELADLVQRGDWFRLNNPWESNWPAGMFLDTEGKVGVVFWFQVRDHTRGDVAPPLRLLGLEREREYGLDGKRYNGGDLMDTGISIREHGDYRSRIMRLARV